MSVPEEVAENDECPAGRWVSRHRRSLRFIGVWVKRASSRPERVFDAGRRDGWAVCGRCRVLEREVSRHRQCRRAVAAALAIALVALVSSLTMSTASAMEPGRVCGYDDSLKHYCHADNEGASCVANLFAYYSKYTNLVTFESIVRCKVPRRAIDVNVQGTWGSHQTKMKRAQCFDDGLVTSCGQKATERYHGPQTYCVVAMVFVIVDVDPGTYLSGKHCVRLPLPPGPGPPSIPNKRTAQAELNALTVAPENTAPGYNPRKSFPRWTSTFGRGCDTRKTVLKRDGDGVKRDAQCDAIAGSWDSPLDAVTVPEARKVDIDHVVSLKEAWRSGANRWTPYQRKAFANDLLDPELIATSERSNRSKGDRDPAAWRPPNTAYRCTYALMWIRVKWQWKLHLQSTEKQALQAMLNTCPS
jgi:Protein of unknown function (DUF1524)